MNSYTSSDWGRVSPPQRITWKSKHHCERMVMFEIRETYLSHLPMTYYATRGLRPFPVRPDERRRPEFEEQKDR